MAPGLFYIILVFHQLAISVAVYFAFFTFSLYHKNTKNIILSSLSDLTFASGREGIDNPFIVLVARFLIVCAGTRDLHVVSYWIDTLVLKNWRKYLRYFAASHFPLQGKTNTCSRGSKKDFWRRCREPTHKSRHTKYPSQTLLPRITLFSICLSFPLPHFTLAVLFTLFFIRIFLLASCLLVCWIVCRDGFT